MEVIRAHASALPPLARISQHVVAWL